MGLENWKTKVMVSIFSIGTEMQCSIKYKLQKDYLKNDVDQKILNYIRYVDTIFYEY